MITHQLRDEARLHLKGGYTVDEVVSIISVYHPELDEFQLEDLDKVVQNLDTLLTQLKK